MKNSKLTIILIISIIINAFLFGSILSPQITKLKSKVLNGETKPTPSQTTTTATKDNVFDEINPVSGFEIDASYGNLGPKMIASGVIDREKFKNIYEKSNQPLTPEQENILFKGSNEKIK